MLFLPPPFLPLSLSSLPCKKRGSPTWVDIRITWVANKEPPVSGSLKKDGVMTFESLPRPPGEKHKKNDQNQCCFNVHMRLWEILLNKLQILLQWSFESSF